MERTLSIIKPDATARNITGKVNAMIEQMTSAPVVVQILEAENAIALYRKIMGATNPAVAEEGTIRRTFALSIDKNTVHGSDSAESAEREIDFFFSHIEIVG